MSRWASLTVAALLPLGQACTLESAGKGNTIIDAGVTDGGTDSGPYAQSAPAADPWLAEPDPWATSDLSDQNADSESSAAD